jgi:hypothetical protein
VADAAFCFSAAHTAVCHSCGSFKQPQSHDNFVISIPACMLAELELSGAPAPPAPRTTLESKLYLHMCERTRCPKFSADQSTDFTTTTECGFLREQDWLWWRRELTGAPCVCTLGVLWADGQADAPTREGVLNSIQTELDTRKLFDNHDFSQTPPDQPALPALRSMVWSDDTCQPACLRACVPACLRACLLYCNTAVSAVVHDAPITRGSPLADVRVCVIRRSSRPQICYYGKHFVAFVKQPPSAAAAPGDWVSYDDANVRNLGSDFDAVRERCAKAHWQPLLLFYEKPEPT